MTDKEIIKALGCCKNADCLNCPRWTEEWYSGMCNEFLQDVLDLINRQKAEIERLQKHNTEMARRHYTDGIKAFAEKLCEGRVSNDPVVIAAKCLLKEMTEEST